MTILVEDSPRNLAAWIVDAIRGGLVRGGVITPWATPWHSKPFRRGAVDFAIEMSGAGGIVWFDPLTHALQMDAVGDFRYYDEYDLWAGPRGDLSTEANRTAHIEKVFAVQQELGARRLAPTILLHHPITEHSARALELAQEAIAQDQTTVLSIAGSSAFWSSGSALDAHVGALAQSQPSGWFLTVVRPHINVPVAASEEEVYGLCRTVRALSEYAPVHVSHGDLAGLPAVAAGATSLGTGWDKRQRVCSAASFEARVQGDGGGGWFERVTLEGLLGSLRRPEAEVLFRLDPARATRLGGLPPPGPQEAFRANVAAVRNAAQRIIASNDYEARFHEATALYAAAEREWPEVTRLTGSTTGATEWIAPLSAGLAAYGRSEGW